MRLAEIERLRSAEQSADLAFHGHEACLIDGDRGGQTVRSLLVSRLRSPVNTEGGDAPGARRREEGAYRAYVTDEQRRAPGCSAGRM